MNDDDDEAERQKKLREALDRGVEELRAVADALGDMNSLFPATREFLARCGATHVKELTPEQMRELTAYLTAERDALLGKKGPSN
jgi:hypothetical protein